MIPNSGSITMERSRDPEKYRAAEQNQRLVAFNGKSLGRGEPQEQGHDQRQPRHYLVARGAVQEDEPQGAIVILGRFIKDLFAHLLPFLGSRALVGAQHAAPLLYSLYRPADSNDSSTCLTRRDRRRSEAAKSLLSCSLSIKPFKTPRGRAGVRGVMIERSGSSGFITTFFFFSPSARWENTSSISSRG